jgi:hypothetical protein
MLIRTVATATLGLGICLAVVGCGADTNDNPQTCTTTPEFTSLFPANNEVTGWTIGPVTAFRTTSSDTEIERMIDGAAEPYIDLGFEVWGERQYTDGTNSLLLDLFQVASVAKNQQIWNAELAAGSTYTHWTTINGWADMNGLGDAARVANVNDINLIYDARKCAYQLEATASNQTTGSMDAAGRSAVETFLKAVLDRIPQ